MELLFGNARYLATNDFVEIIDFYKPISNLWGNILLYDKIGKSQDLFLRNAEGKIAQIKIDELSARASNNELLGIIVYKNYREFNIYHFWTTKDTNFLKIESNIPNNIKQYEIVGPILIIGLSQFENYDADLTDLTFRLGRYSDGRFVVFLHPSIFKDKNFEVVETHESNCPGRIPAE